MEIQLAFNNPRRGTTMKKKKNPTIVLSRKIKGGGVQKRSVLVPNRKDMKQLSQEAKPLVQKITADRKAASKARKTAAKKASAFKKQVKSLDKDLKSFKDSKRLFAKDKLKEVRKLQKDGFKLSPADEDFAVKIAKGSKVAKKTKKTKKSVAKAVKKAKSAVAPKKAAKKKKTKKASKKIAKSSPVSFKGKKATKKAAKKATKKVAKKSTKKAAKKSTKKSGKKAAKKVVEAVSVAPKKAVKKAAKKSTKKAAKKSTKKAAKKSTKKASKKSTKKASKKSTKKASKKSTKKAAKKSTGFKKATKSAKKTFKKKAVYGVTLKNKKPFLQRLNPFGGNMLKKIEKVIAHDSMEAGGLLVGGASIQGINHAIAKFAPTLKTTISTIPVIGAFVSKNLDAIIPLALGAAANYYVKNDKVKAVAKGVIGAAVVNIGASLYNAAASMAGANLSGIVAVPNMGNINYQQKDYGMGRLINSENMSGEEKALGVSNTDFGSMGYVENSDFNSTMMSGYGEESDSMN